MIWRSAASMSFWCRICAYRGLQSCGLQGHFRFGAPQRYVTAMSFAQSAVKRRSQPGIAVAANADAIDDRRGGQIWWPVSQSNRCTKVRSEGGIHDPLIVC
jgi:hypothetical protein